MRILAPTLGSSGDVDPIVGLGRILRDRGHEVLVLTHAPFERHVRGAGLGFIAVDTEEEYRAHLQKPGMNPLILFIKNLSRSLEPVYRLIREQYQEGNTLVLAQSSALGARIAQDRWGIPTVSVHLSPLAFRSGPRPKAVALDNALLPFLNQFRQSLGLAPVSDIYLSWYHSPTLVVGLFPDWFAGDHQLLPQAVLTGFPLYDGSGVQEVPADLEAFLQAGSPPLVFTFGTAMTECGPLLQASARVCEALEKRGILLTRSRDQVPPSLPAGVRHFDFVPFSAVLPRAAGMVHHGGIGTTAQALAAGIPQLVVPFGFDQPDNAHMLEMLGVGSWIRPEEYAPEAVAERLRSMLNSSQVRSRCLEFQARIRQQRPLEEAADAIEQLTRSSASPISAHEGTCGEK